MRTLASLASLLLVAAPLAQVRGIPWLTDLDGARAIAVKSGKPMLVVFRCEA